MRTADRGLLEGLGAGAGWTDNWLLTTDYWSYSYAAKWLWTHGAG